MSYPTKRGTIHLAAYATSVVLLSMAAGWSTFELSTALVQVTNGAIIDGSGKAEPEMAREATPPTASEPAPTERLPEAASQPDTAAAEPRIFAAPMRVSSDYAADSPASEYGDGYREVFRTYCVRLCDGYYWPISSSAPSDRLSRDAAACQSSCDSPARLFVHRVSRGGPATMVSLEGLPYTSLKTAFQFRIRYDAQCRCRPQPWDEAATDRHRLYAATDAARKGNRTAAAEAKRLGAKVQAERMQTQAVRDAANVQANRQLAAAAGKSNPEDPRRDRQPFDAHSAMGLGMQPAETGRGRFVPASGSGRAWTDRVFGGD